MLDEQPTELLGKRTSPEEKSEELRPLKMSRASKMDALLVELSNKAQVVVDNPDAVASLSVEWAQQVKSLLCVSVNWCDTEFLAALGSSRLLAALPRVHAALQAAPEGSRASAAAEVALIEEVAKWVRGELLQAEKRLPGSSLLGSRTAYPSWAAVGLALALMAQAASLPKDAALQLGVSYTHMTKLLTNKQALAHAAEVTQSITEAQRLMICVVLLNQLVKDLGVAKGVLGDISKLLAGGDESTAALIPSSLPKTWYILADIFTVYPNLLRPIPNLGPASLAPIAAGAAEQLPASPLQAAKLGGNTSSSSDAGADPMDTSPSSHRSEMEQHADESPGPSSRLYAEDELSPKPADEAQPEAAAAAAMEALPPPPEPSTAAAAGDDAAVAPAEAAAPEAESSARDAIAKVLALAQEVVSSLASTVTRAHALGRTVLLLRGEAVSKYPNAAAFMPAALNANDLLGHLDCITTLATSMQFLDSIKDSLTQVLTSQALKDLLGVAAGKIYISTVISVGVLCRIVDLATVVPQGLRQGYMAAVLPALETGALLNERRAPQVLAYRNNVTESSYYQVMDADALPHGVNIRYEDETDAEGQGVVREWLSAIAADLFKPERGLFVRGAEDARVVHPSASSGAQDDHLGYIRFAGRIVGLAVRANVPLGLTLSTALFKALTGRKALLSDLKQVDPQVTTTCSNILSTEGAESLDLYHVWSTPSAGDAELLPGGEHVRVTDNNKATYVDLLANHLLQEAVKEQIKAFAQGLADVAVHLPDNPHHRGSWLSPLCIDDINRVTAGESNLDIGDWAAHTDFVGFETEEELAVIDMFWEMLADYSQEERQRLLQFWSALTHLPSGGFKAISQRLQVMKLAQAPRAQPAQPGGGAQPQRRPEEQGEGAGPAAHHGLGAAAAAHAATIDAAPDLRSHELPNDVMDDDAEQDDLEQSAGASGQPGPRQANQAASGSNAMASTAAGAARAAAAPTDDSGSAAGRDAGAGAAASAQEDVGPAGGPSGDGAGVSDPAAAHQEPPPQGLQEPVTIQAGGQDGAGMDEEYDDGYGDEEDEEEEFQRQLTLALQLSLHEDSAAPQAPGQGQAAPSEAGPSEQRHDQQQQQQGAASEQQAQEELGDRRQHTEPAGELPDGSHGPASEAGVSAPATGPVPTSPPPDADPAAASASVRPGLPHAGLGGSSEDGAADGQPAGPQPVLGAAAAAFPATGASLAGSNAAAASTDVTIADGSSASQAGTYAANPNGGASSGVAAAESAPARDDMENLPSAAASPEPGPMQDDPLQPPSGPASEPASASAAAGLEVDAPGPADAAVAVDAATTATPVAAAAEGAGTAEAEPADAMDVDVAAGASVAAAGAEQTKAPSNMLPQARTCFMQLNLPVYSSPEELRRAFTIALDNMAFGMQ